MFNFFVDSSNISNDTVLITGNDYNHAKKVLRMKVGDCFLISHDGVSSLCEISEFTESTIIAKITEENYQNTELPVKFYLFQGLPKSDKFELVIQKAVELGVHAIVPVEMNRCVVKLDDKKKKQKQARWQSIAESAAKHHSTEPRLQTFNGSNSASANRKKAVSVPPPSTTPGSTNNANARQRFFIFFSGGRQLVRQRLYS